MENETENAIGNLDASELCDFVNRIENLESEEAQVKATKRDVYAEAKSRGFDNSTLKKLIALRKKEDDVRQNEDLLMETYKRAVGMY